ncbi:MAG: hypothetical protein ACI4HI_17975 [Lachnospiraceae bacterium]
MYKLDNETKLILLIVGYYFLKKFINWVRKKQNLKRRRAAEQVNQNRPSIFVPVKAENNTGVGPCVYYANDRHQQRDKEYKFYYKKVEDSWRAYILRMPSLGGRDPSGVVTHRLYDNGSPYVCWDSPVNSLKDMQTISKVWADNIQEYIATGKLFG